MNSNFLDAVKKCQKDCFGVGSCPSSFNAMKCLFDRRQEDIDISMKDLNKSEKDTVLRSKMFSELKKRGTTIVATNVRVNLEYDESFNGQQISICEDCFISLYNQKSKRTYESWKSSMKRQIIFDISAADVQSRLPSKRKQKNCEKAHYRGIYEARNALQSFHLTEEQLHLACIPSTAKARQAYQWMSNFFTMTGDVAPNRENLVQLPGFYTKSGIYDVFKRAVTIMYTGDEHDVASKTLFKQIWKNVYPQVRIARYCQVSGKCDACYWIYERQEILNSERDLKELRKFAVVHKVFIESERKVYMNKRQLAQQFQDLYMSLIMDGMSQDHCVLPWCGNQVQSSFPLKQKIIGAKQHGFSKSFYRVFPHIKGGANVACEVLLHEIEKKMRYCKKKNLTMAQVLFLQIDGGPENIAKTFYALCEQLVKDGVFHRVEICRLPVGHTHEDIDALFGILWKKAQKQTIMTPQEWKRMCLAAFNQNFDVDDEELDDDEDDDEVKK